MGNSSPAAMGNSGEGATGQRFFTLPRSAVGCAWPLLALLVGAGCASVPTSRSGPRETPPPELVRAAWEGERLLAAAQAVAREDWVRLDIRAEPLIVTTDLGALLFDAKPSHGFAPLRGKACPCFRRRRIPTQDGNVEVWILTADEREWPAPSEGAIELFALQPGALIPLVVESASPDAETFQRAIRALFVDSQLEGNAIKVDAVLAAYQSSPIILHRLTWLLEEQRLLARALESPEGNHRRGELIRQWIAVRSFEAVRGFISAEAISTERIGGLAFYLGAQAAGRLNGWSRAELERRLAAGLRAGGRDVWPGLWFASLRQQQTGAAIVALVADLSPGDVLPGGQYFASQKSPAGLLMKAIELNNRWPGMERELRMSTENRRIALAAEEPPPTPVPSSGDSLEAGMRAMAVQATLRLTLEIPHGYDLGYSPSRASGTKLHQIADGRALLSSATAFVRWFGLFAVKHDPPDEGIVLYSFRKSAGSTLQSGPTSLFPRLELSDGLKIDRSDPKDWRVVLPPP